ncbi:MAG: tRNA (N(6)-L-threonylcarbamoyladenosine(37)-C(2))-methylthiotransferase MtaB [Clostridia bacterium]|nr:tRNA (N(6)-L-threonylcarbamoyladenosine(37)-C(2))-methylthiotransferase MtaB [Clostridia bacterium]
MKRVAFYTLGCKVNQYETNAMIDIFKNNGYDIVDFTEYADVYIVNTCTVTSMSDKKSRQVLRRAKHLNPNSVLCAVGCYAQVSKSDLEKIEDIDIILGTVEKKDILKIVEEYEKDKKKLISVENIMKLQPYQGYDGTAYTEHARAEIKVQDGCDRFCSYCIIPYARGPVRSRKPFEILEEIRKISKSGVKEVVITGIHISSYGKDLDGSYGLIELLEEINQIDELKRIRLGSLEPRIITEDFVQRLVKLDKICNHFHLSLQSGCDETLKRMNRKYTTEEFKHIVKLLREYIPEVALTTDVIVGFPGETDDEFKQTVEFLKEINFSKMHIFKYSIRKGTPAATYPNQVPDDKKEERSNILLEMSDIHEKEFAENYIGKEIEVLFENEMEGHTTNYIRVVRKNRKEQSEIKLVKPLIYEKGALYV